MSRRQTDHLAGVAARKRGNLAQLALSRLHVIAGARASCARPWTAISLILAGPPPFGKALLQDPPEVVLGYA